MKPPEGYAMLSRHDTVRPGDLVCLGPNGPWVRANHTIGSRVGDSPAQGFARMTESPAGEPGERKEEPL